LFICLSFIFLFHFEIIVFIIEDFDQTLSDEVHFLNITLVRNNYLAWGVDSAVHVDN
jgi:hypothetical protein